jgi:hypothetical protein
MKKIFISLAAIATLTACSKSSSDLSNSSTSATNAVMGAYSGEFTRTGTPDTGYFMIDINMVRYDGSSRDPGFPGICGGYYTLSGSTINFDDTCYAGTARVMLEGSYNYHKNGDSLRFWRTVNGITDDYRMARIFR